MQNLCVLGIDPDISGAIAVMHWEMASNAAQLQLQDAVIELHDMPTTSVAIGKRLRRLVAVSLFESAQPV